MYLNAVPLVQDSYGQEKSGKKHSFKGSQEKSGKVMKSQEMSESQEKVRKFYQSNDSMMLNCGVISMFNVHWSSLKHKHVV